MTEITSQIRPGIFTQQPTHQILFHISLSHD
jgi:hypothetical protein